MSRVRELGVGPRSLSNVPLLLACIVTSRLMVLDLERARCVLGVEIRLSLPDLQIDPARNGNQLRDVNLERGRAACWVSIEIRLPPSDLRTSPA